MISPAASLRAVKAIHTFVWAFFVGCILAIPIYAFRREFVIASLLIAVVLAEVLVIVANNWTCPLTRIAARYTEDRQDNFDIYLPLWLARYNKQVFGGLYFGGVIYTIVKWQNWF